MAPELITKVRLVRCPKCRQLLPELPTFKVYRCGGCGALLPKKDGVPLLGNGSHDDNSDYDDQHYQTARSDDSILGDSDELGNVASVVGSDVFNPLVSTDYDDSGNLASAVGPSGSNPPGSVVINIGLQVENNDPHHRTKGYFRRVDLYPRWFHPRNVFSRFRSGFLHK